MGRSRRRKKKSKVFIRYFCLFICAVILFTSLLIGDDTKAYGEGRSAIYKNPINPDYESNDNGVKTSFRFRLLNNLSGEAEYGSNAMSLISVSDEDNKRSTIKNFADILDMDIYSNLCFCANIENSSGVDRNISVDIILPSDVDGSISTIRLINSSLDIFKGDLTGVDIKYEMNDGSVTEAQRKSGKELDFNKVKTIKIDGKISAGQKFEGILPMEIIENNSLPEKKDDFVDDLKTIDEINTDNNFDFKINYRYPIKKELDLSIATCHGSERVEDFSKGKIVGIAKRDEESYDILPSDIIEKFGDADTAFFSMFTVDEKRDDFVNDYSFVSVDTKGLQDLVKDSGYSLLIEDFALKNKYDFIAGEKKHIYEDGLELNLGKKDKYGHILSKVYVEFQKVLDCRDSEVALGREWNKFDNLVSARLQSDGKTIDIDRDKIKVESNVDTKTKGDYTVKYSYEILPDIRVSNIAKVKVVEDTKTLQTDTESKEGSNVKIE